MLSEEEEEEEIDLHRREIVGQFTLQRLSEVLILLLELLGQLSGLFAYLSHHLFSLLNQRSLLLSPVLDHLLQVLFRSSLEDIVRLLEHVRRCFLEGGNDRLIEGVAIGADHRRLNGIGHSVTQTVHDVLVKRERERETLEHRGGQSRTLERKICVTLCFITESVASNFAERSLCRLSFRS